MRPVGDGLVKRDDGAGAGDTVYGEDRHGDPVQVAGVLRDDLDQDVGVAGDVVRGDDFGYAEETRNEAGVGLAARRPLVAVAARRWPWLTGLPPAQLSSRALAGLTAAWGIGLLAAAAVQGAGALTGGLASTNPASFAFRALIALAVEAALATLTIACMPGVPRRPGLR